MDTAIAERPLLETRTNATDHWFAASRITLVAMLMAAPLAFGAVQPWAWTTMCVLSGIAVVLWAMACATLGRIRITWSPLYVVALLSLILVACQFMLGKTVDPIGTRESLIKLAGYCIIFLCCRTVLDRSVRSCLEMAWFNDCRLTVFAMAVFAIIQFFSNAQLIYWIVKPRWGGSIFGQYVNHNHYAGLLEVLLPLAIGALLGLPEHHAFKILGAFAALLGLTSVLLCGSRGGTVAVIVELAIFFVVIVRRAASF